MPNVDAKKMDKMTAGTLFFLSSCAPQRLKLGVKWSKNASIACNATCAELQILCCTDGMKGNFPRFLIKEHWL